MTGCWIASGQLELVAVAAYIDDVLRLGRLDLLVPYLSPRALRPSSDGDLLVGNSRGRVVRDRDAPQLKAQDHLPSASPVRSPLTSNRPPDATRAPFTNVPFLLSRSRILWPSASSTICACMRETYELSMNTSTLEDAPSRQTCRSRGKTRRSGILSPPRAVRTAPPASLALQETCGRLSPADSGQAAHSDNDRRQGELYPRYACEASITPTACIRRTSGTCQVPERWASGCRDQGALDWC